MTDIDAILNERGQRYGKFLQHAQIAQLLKNVMTGNFDVVEKMLQLPGAAGLSQALAEKWAILDSDMTESLEMQMHKVARILNGDPDYADSWDDIAGYAKLVGDRLKGDAK